MHYVLTGEEKILQYSCNIENDIFSYSLDEQNEMCNKYIDSRGWKVFILLQIL